MAFWDTLFGNDAADAANQAAQDTYLKQLEAGRGIRDAGDRYQGDMEGYARAYDPYISSGKSALSRLLGGLGLEGGDSPEAFTTGYRSLPGYESGLETGTNAALRGVNASGMSNSGRALKALQRFGSDYEDQRVGSYLDRLFGLQGQGLQATGAKTGVRSQGAGGRLGAYTTAGQQDYGSAGTIGEGMVAGENARSTALQNLLGTAAYLGGSWLGGGGGGNLAKSFFGGNGGYGNSPGDWNPNVPGGRR
jgi:hypothetical protein